MDFDYMALENDGLEGKLRTIAKRYGFPLQSRQCMEEMGELIQALNHYYRCMHSLHAWEVDEAYAILVEELADVQIMLWQIEYLLGINVTGCIASKINQTYANLPEERSEVE